MIQKTNYELIKGYTSRFDLDKGFQETIDGLGSDPSFEETYKAMETLFTGKNMPQFVSTLNLVFHINHMKKSGEKIYHITPGLSAKLAQTDVNVDSYFIRSPFREIYIQIEPGLFFMKDPYSKVTPVTGFYVYLKDFETYKQIRVLANGLSKTPDGAGLNAIFFLKMELKPGKVKEQVKEYIAEHLITQGEDIIRFGASENIDYWDEFMFFVFNTLLYITSKNPDFSNYIPENIEARLKGLKNPAKKRKFEQRMGKLSRCPIVVVGSQITDKYTEDIQAAGGIGAWKLKARVKVSGHWRVQWYGSESNSTRRAETIWISDYEKGPEMAELLKNPFIVK